MMNKTFGEVTLCKTNIETGEVTEHVENNTQLAGMAQNLTYVSNGAWWNNTETNAIIYITDSTNTLNRLTGDLNTTAQTYMTPGTAISGEFWPQYNFDTVNKRAVFTFKKRFLPLVTTRTINTIGLYADNRTAFLAALKLLTPCTQTSSEILDVYYKLYVYYDDTLMSDRDLNQRKIGISNIIPKAFYNFQTNLYLDGTSTRINLSNQNDDVIGYLPMDLDISNSATTYTTGLTFGTNNFYQFPQITPTITLNASQGTERRVTSMTVSQQVGTLIGKQARLMNEYKVNSTGYRNLLNAENILKSGDSRVQSVYLKSASSTATNFAYLDPSTIGSSTATLVLNDSGWTKPTIPTMFKVSITTGGGAGVGQYKVSTRTSFGFANNTFSTENWFPIVSVWNRYFTVDNPVNPHINNTYNTKYNNIRRVNDETVVSSSLTGITITNVYTSAWTNFDSTTTPALTTTAIQDVQVAPDGSIYVATTDNGLLKLSADRTTVTKFTGIGSGVNDNTCYTLDIKHNGDVWAMFDGGLARLVESTGVWTVYNSSTPITFIHSEYNPTWSNTLKLSCRKDSGSDEILLSRQNSGLLTWWSPSAPTPVNTTSATTGAVNKTYSNTNRGEYTRAFCNLPGTSTWFWINNSYGISRATFGTNTQVAVGVNTQSTSILSPLQEYMYNGSWTVRVHETLSTGAAGSIRLLNASGTVITMANINASATTNVIGPCEWLDDQFNAVIVNALNTTSVYGVAVAGMLNPLNESSWKNYGWNGSAWELNHAGSKTVNTSMEPLFDGVNNSFTLTGTNDFIVGERWVGYIYNGLHKDNSTTATLTLATHSRDNYLTDDLSSYTVPASALGLVTEDFTPYTLDKDTAYAWKGSFSRFGYDSASVVNSLKSETIVAGDFTFNFYASQYSTLVNTTNTTTYIGLYQASLSATSKYAFQFRNDGYLVAEDDVARTSRVLPGAADKFTIKRVGSTITYLVNDVLVYTSLVTNSNPMRGIFRLGFSDQSRTFYNMKMTHTNANHIVYIGDAVNQTGVYDPKYAMIEGWLTAPRTLNITLNGVAATVLTDPTVAPTAGQVLLLQKNGQLIFNSADAGKTIVSEALVLREY